MSPEIHVNAIPDYATIHLFLAITDAPPSG
jgi:hypothetical protein